MRSEEGDTLQGFQWVEEPRASVLTRPEAADWVRHVLGGRQTLHGAASVDRDADAIEGRATVYVIPAKVGKAHREGEPGRWAVRHYARGGRFVPTLLGDRYLKAGPLRPFHEARASEVARARGVPTPRVMVAALYPTRLFYRADLVTEFIPDATDLVRALFDAGRTGVGGAMERQDALRASGELIRAMAMAGLRHTDLHAGNILLRWEGAAPRPHLLDLDRCQVDPDAVPVSPESMVRRLEHSLRKWEGWTGLTLTEVEWDILAQAAMG
jgi:3-deoxy-D-manno-octulosonic acid kinase